MTKDLRTGVLFDLKQVNKSGNMLKWNVCTFNGTSKVHIVSRFP